MPADFELPSEVLLLPEDGTEVIDRRRIWKFAGEFARDGDWVIVEARSNPKVRSYKYFQQRMDGTMKGFGTIYFEDNYPNMKFSNQKGEIALPGFIKCRPSPENPALEYLSVRVIRVYNPTPAKRDTEDDEDTWKEYPAADANSDLENRSTESDGDDDLYDPSDPNDDFTSPTAPPRVKKSAVCNSKPDTAIQHEEVKSLLADAQPGDEVVVSWACGAEQGGDLY